MISNFLSRLFAQDAAPLEDADARLAIAVLMVRLARSDEDYAEEERIEIDAMLARRYDLSEADLAALRHEAEEIEAEAQDTVKFTRAIKDKIAIEDRISVMRDFWNIALADGTRDAHENAQMRLMTGLLGLTDQESARARQMAEQ
jgi:uncharacterized tellurite resistance protein B-like protein